MSALEIIQPKRAKKIKAAIFDFDGTLSTLRFGWEEIMLSCLCSVLESEGLYSGERRQELIRFIRETTGVQTVFQMQGFVELLKGWQAKNIKDPWYYKDLYNEALMVMVKGRAQNLMEGKYDPSLYRIEGSIEFLTALSERGIRLFIASGTDHEDVVREVKALGFSPFFRDIKGAPHRKMACPKEAAFEEAVQYCAPGEILMAGDGKVEIALADRKGAWPLGIASNEAERQGVDPVKKERLIAAGAWALTGDFSACTEILEWLSL